jgi:hypothetical protein
LAVRIAAMREVVITREGLARPVRAFVVTADFMLHRRNLNRTYSCESRSWKISAGKYVGSSLHNEHVWMIHELGIGLADTSLQLITGRKRMICLRCGE